MLKNLPYVPKFNLPEIVLAMKHEDGKTYIDCSVYQDTVCKREKELKNVLIICPAVWCVGASVVPRCRGDRPHSPAPAYFHNTSGHHLYTSRHTNMAYNILYWN